MHFIHSLGLSWSFESACVSRFECMFDSEFAAAGDAELVAAIEDGARQEAIAGARRLAAIAELTKRRVDDDDERAMWAFDPVGFGGRRGGQRALNVGHRRASGQMRIALALRDRLPQVAALYRKGELSSRIVSTITWLTQLVEDEQALALIDDALADRAPVGGRLSEDKLRQAIEVWVARYDPDALRRTQTMTRGRDLTIGACDDDDRNHLGVGTTAGHRRRRPATAASPRWPAASATAIRAAWVNGAPTHWAPWPQATSTGLRVRIPDLPGSGRTTQVQRRHPGDRRPSRRRRGRRTAPLPRQRRRHLQRHRRRRR